jgi:hypothetical protein
MSATDTDAAAQLRAFAWAAFATVARRRVRWCLLHRPWEVPSALADWLQARRYGRACATGAGPAPASLAEFLAGDEGGRW